MARKYEAIWNRIKQTGSAKVVISPHIYSTVKKGVITEKCNDITFKLAMDNSCISTELNHTFDGNMITFTLTKNKRKINLGDL